MTEANPESTPVDRTAPLVSCLCVTGERAAFMPWLLWNFDKQDHARRELVVVDSSRMPLQAAGRSDLRVVPCPHPTGIARKRNLALTEARGQIVTWFDDDDWQHPSKLSLLARALDEGALIAGNAQSWLVDLMGARARLHRWERSLLFNSVGVRTGLVGSLRFDERLVRASDTPWIRAAQAEARAARAVLQQPLFFWLCHARNHTNPVQRHVFSHPLAAVREAIGPAAWGDTDLRLRELRARLKGS